MDVTSVIGWFKVGWWLVGRWVQLQRTLINRKQLTDQQPQPIPQPAPGAREVQAQRRGLPQQAARLAGR
jgi:hypothetical protein